jgi:ribosome-associated protein
LVTLIRRAFDVPRKRKKTQPTLASKQRRLADKKQRSEIKRARRNFEAE